MLNSEEKNRLFYKAIIVLGTDTGVHTDTVRKPWETSTRDSGPTDVRNAQQSLKNASQGDHADSICIVRGSRGQSRTFIVRDIDASITQTGTLSALSFRTAFSDIEITCVSKHDMEITADQGHSNVHWAKMRQHKMDVAHCKCG